MIVAKKVELKPVEYNRNWKTYVLIKMHLGSKLASIN